MKAGRSLPFTLGHEIAGVVEQVGADVAEAEPGERVAVFPWIGCRNCTACRRGHENICAASRHLGINVDGGFASHVLVPHPRYLLRYEPLPEAFAAILMCSGLTAYAALKRLTDEAALGPLLLVGMGGVGMMGLMLAHRMFAYAPLIADIDPAKREAALAAGAAMAFDPSDQDTRKKLLAATGGGVHGACDFVGSAQSVAFATGTIAKGGKVLVTGLFGGTLPIAVALFALKAMTIQGIQTGTLDEARELLDFARERNLSFPAIHERPLGEAQAALEALRAGRVVGRTVLLP